MTGPPVIGIETSHPGPFVPTSVLDEIADHIDSSPISFWAIRHESESVLDPSTVAAYLARRTSRVALAVEAAAHHEHPYNTARRLLTLDHLTNGRTAWIASTKQLQPSRWLPTLLMPTHVDEGIRAVKALWRTWPWDSLVTDREAGWFADTTRITTADHQGRFESRGPLCIPTSAAGLPLVFAPSLHQTRSGAADVELLNADSASRPSRTAVGSRPRVVRVDCRSTEHSGSWLDTVAAAVEDSAGAVAIDLAVRTDQIAMLLDVVLPALLRERVLAPTSGEGLSTDLGVPRHLPAAPQEIPA